MSPSWPILVLPGLALLFIAPAVVRPRLGAAETRLLRPLLFPGGAAALLGAAGLSGCAAEAFLLFWLAVAAAIDYQVRLVPDRWVIAGVLGAIALVLVTGEAVGARLAWAATSAGLLLAVRVLGRLATGLQGLGLGDVKAGLVCGLCVGWEALPLLWFSMSLAGLVGGAGRMSGRLAPRSYLPLMPFVFAGALVWFAARSLLTAYLAFP